MLGFAGIHEMCVNIEFVGGLNQKYCCWPQNGRRTTVLIRFRVKYARLLDVLLFLFMFCIKFGHFTIEFVVKKQCSIYLLP